MTLLSASIPHTLGTFQSYVTARGTYNYHSERSCSRKYACHRSKGSTGEKGLSSIFFNQGFYANLKLGRPSRPCQSTTTPVGTVGP